MEKLSKQIQEQFNKINKIAIGYFRSTVSGERVWEEYLKGFGEDPIFRANGVHNCNYCHSFFSHFGNIVAVDSELNVHTLFSLPLDEVDEEYKESIKRVDKLLKSHLEIQSICAITYQDLLDWKKADEPSQKRGLSSYVLGIPRNTKRYTKEEALLYPGSGIKENDVFTFHHINITVPSSFIDFSGKSSSMLVSEIDSKVISFSRGMSEISLDTLKTVVELGEQGSLLNSESYKGMLEKVIELKKDYEKVPNDKKHIWCWVIGKDLHPSIAGFRGTAIGTLLVDLSKGESLTESVLKYNKIVDPANYKKATAPITKRQIEEAKKFVEENGYADSFNRRCATIDDIKVTDILHYDADATEVKTKISIFDTLTPSTKPTCKITADSMDKITSVDIEEFMKTVLPGSKEIEVYLQGRHKDNFMTLTTSEKKDSKQIFGWSNNFSWTYNGNLAGKSLISRTVKSMGGKIDAPFRASMIWNEDGRSGNCDLDLHCIEENSRDHIFFGSHNIHRNEELFKNYKSKNGGVIDIDIISPNSQCKETNGVAVENIYYPEIRDGIYKFFIHNYNNESNSGARAEIVFNNRVFNFNIQTRIFRSEDIDLATLTVNGGMLVDIKLNTKYSTGSDEISETIYGLDTCKFHKVSLVCLSPNYWENKFGNKHYFFFLKGAKAPGKIRSFHNENLKEDLSKHRKVMEVLGSQVMVDSSSDQLSGLGFNSTIRDEVIVKVDNKLMKIKF